MTNRRYIFLSVVIAIIFIIIVGWVLLGGHFSSQTNNQPTPGEAVSNDLAPTGSQTVTQNQSAKVGELIGSLPHQDTYFKFDFDFNKSVFVLSIKRTNIASGNKDFDNYLKQNGITDRSWIKNLTVTYY